MSIVNLIAIVVIPIVAVIIGQMLQNRAQKKKRQNSDIQNFNDGPSIWMDKRECSSFELA